MVEYYGEPSSCVLSLFSNPSIGEPTHPLTQSHRKSKRKTKRNQKKSLEKRLHSQQGEEVVDGYCMYERFARTPALCDTDDTTPPCANVYKPGVKATMPVARLIVYGPECPQKQKKKSGGVHRLDPFYTKNAVFKHSNPNIKKRHGLSRGLGSYICR